MGSGTSGPAVAPAFGKVLLLAVMVASAYALSQALTHASFGYAMAALAAVTLIAVVFVRNDWGVYVVTFSMLLSPEFSAGGGGIAEGRTIMVRSEDFVLIVIGFAWLAKTAVNKELGLVGKTPLNRPIALYIGVNVVSTILGYLTGNVNGASGFFYVLKYVEYFVVYYMVVNNIQDRDHARRLVIAALLTAAIVSLVGIAQIPSGDRVSAPFEGEVGEPNTFGGYLLFMMAIAGGIALETHRLRLRTICLGLVGLMALPFAFTLSRASYLGVVPAVLTLTALTRQRRFMVGLLLLLVVASPILMVALPKPVKQRILYTFEPEQGQATVRIHAVGVAFDPSTSARFFSFRSALEGWTRRPVFGYGVTGFGFMDAQYARILVETGVVGFAAFLILVGTTLRSARGAFQELREPEDRGLALGFLAGTVGLLVHAVGSNTFIIVRIMEPFWFFAGIVIMLPTLEDRSAASSAPSARRFAPSAPTLPRSPGDRRTRPAP
ncbi:MAG TPA: O-antigen ligase family protein [Methylomirabilota bacterium]|nr:O-antigen ligase family protein [Methylomirabilota bacterium]